MKNVLLISFLSIIGCAKNPGNYKIPTDNKSADASDSEQADSLWQNRGDKDSLIKALDLYEKQFAASPDDRDLAARLVRGYYFLGDAHETEMDAKKVAWDKAFAYGQECLSKNPDYDAVIKKSGNKVEAIKMAKKEDVPCIYWSASSLGKWAKANGIVQSIKHKSTLFSFISKVQELDPDYFHAAANRYWGAYYSVIPSFAGRDLNKSKENFEKSIEIAPYYLGTYILLADTYARNAQDHATFDQAVQYVMASDAEAINPDLLVENKVEIEKAAELWKERSSIFADAPEPEPLKNQPPQKQEPAPEQPAEEPATPETQSPEGETPTPTETTPTETTPTE